ncbi:MAG: diadenylate cyclase [Firmicutes bacterium]|nr:diadenylate cyclase [Bacillota bacterium]
MRITKNSYAGLKTIKDDLSGYFNEIKLDELAPLRLIVLDYSCSQTNAKNEIEILSYFDSDKKIISKETLEGIKFGLFPDKEVLGYFGLSTDTSIIASDLTDEEAITRKARYYIIISFPIKPTPIIQDFTYRFAKIILDYLSRKDMTMKEISNQRLSAFSDAIKAKMDLDIVNNLSSAKYEKRDLTGSIIYIKNLKEIPLKITFKKPIEFDISNQRLLRKVLEMSDKNLSIIVLENKIIGLGQKDALRKVVFSGHQKWTFYAAPKETLKSAHGKYFFDRSGGSLIADMPKGFILKKYEKMFNSLVALLAKQKQGALLIVSDKAKDEVERLSSFDRGYAIDPIDFTKPENLLLIRHLSSVDGAVFIDRQLLCYGTGVILDGVAKSVGNNARGARFNSAACYLDNKAGAPYAAVIISEDETIDVALNSFSTVENLAKYNRGQI